MAVQAEQGEMMFTRKSMRKSDIHGNRLSVAILHRGDR